MKENTRTITDKLLACFSADNLERITIKPLFGGSGVCFDDTMFAWIYADKLYLRGYSEYLTMFSELNMKALAFDTGVIVKLLQYYQVTDRLWQNQQQLKHIIQMVIEYAFKDKQLRQRVKESRIKDLPNMNVSLERALYRAGIVNLDEFKRLGPHRCFLKLKRNNKSVSINVLYTLHCALKGQHVATLSEKQKNQLKKECNELSLLPR